MATHVPQPTPYPDVNAVLRELLTGAKTVLGQRFVGMYLYGSLASGDFDPATSDIDFVVVTDGNLPGETVKALEVLHARLVESGLKWASKLEGSYISERALRRYDQDDSPCPQINEGRFYVAGHGSDWVIQRDILRKQGVILAGPDPQTLIDPLQSGQVQAAVLEAFHEWWEPMLDNPTWLQRSDYQAFAVLTMCRVLYTLRYGTVSSKPVSARWARQALGARRSTLIEQALHWRHDDQLDLLDETLDFIRYTLRQIKKFEGTDDDT